jgi:hypothetical protein
VPEPVTPGSPVWWLDRLEKKLDARQAKIKLYDDYYEGNHPLAFAGEKFRSAFGRLFEAFADNWCDLVVDAVEERLNVEGFRFGSKSADKEAWRMWQTNQLDGDSQMAHTESLVCLESSIIVGPGDDPKTPSITVEHPSQVIVEQAEGQRRTRRAALKVWTDEYGVKMATLYMPGHIWKWQERKPRRAGAIIISNTDIETTKWEIRESGTEPWPLENVLGVVPVVTLANRPRLLKPGISELHRVIPIQDGVNKLVADMLVASEYQAFRQRWLSGHEVPTDPETGQPIEEFRHAIDRMFIVEDEKAQFGEFSTTDLSNFVVGIEMLVQHIASQTRTPPHYFALKGQFPSGDAIKSAETGLVAKTRRKMRHFGEAWEEVMRLAFLVQGDKARYAKTGVVTIWADPESRSEAQHVDAVLKQKAFDIPNEILWEKLGYTPPEIERIKQIRAADKAAGMTEELLAAPTVKRAPITVEP